MSSDPVKVSVGVRAISSHNPTRKPNPQLEKKIIQEVSNPVRSATFAEGMGIRKMSIDKEKNSVIVELDEELHHTLRLIAKWKGLSPEVYLGQLLAEYILTNQK